MRVYKRRYGPIRNMHSANMRIRAREPRSSWRNLVVTTIAIVALAAPVLLGLTTAPMYAQSTQPSPSIPQWQIDAGSKMEFNVASVKRDTSDVTANSNVALGPGDYYSPTGGFFNAVNFPVYNYIIFAYKATADQTKTLRTQVPKWVLSDRFDVQARVAVNPSKDQMRLMMQSLLADRFKLVVHRETRQLPVFALLQDKPGKMGPQLQPHPADASCSTNPQTPSAYSSSPPPTIAGGFPVTCGGIQPMPANTPGRLRIGGRNVTMALIASTLPAMPSGPDRPVLDQTGLSGNFDFVPEWTPESLSSTVQTDTSGPTFLEAFKEQLGLKLEATKGPVDVLVIDQIEEPSPN